MPSVIYQLGGSFSGAGLGALDVREDEIAAANIADLTAWPYASTYGVNDARTGFLDRMKDIDRLLYIPSDPRAFISARTGEVPTYKTGVGTASGIVVPAYGNTGSFTIAALLSVDAFTANDGVKVGPTSIPGGGTYWTLGSDTSGRFRVGTGAALGAFTDYTGPVLATNAWRRVLMEFDRALGRFRLRVDGAWQLSKSDSSYLTASFGADMAFGGFNNGSSFSTTSARYVEPMLFGRVLTDAEIAVIDALQAAAGASLVMG